ncbi:DUF6480 family protein [Streptomyces sp. MST-110588]|uniref:DUF6480 family protein n=1 Tax=Streptomyces sp. MST-110588 TaxID=2833628 RepID=UPI001F5D7026|nr:DUF6480 family protein [Streptomyces sp. MST-110588]UNO43198.1 hypothetical protein KGS77_31525 [Streptomyces sp. MST-110588]
MAGPAQNPDPKNPDPANPDPKNPDPSPGTTPGLEGGGGVPPGETPPAESSMSGAGPRETYNPGRGWSRGPLLLLALVVVLCAIFFLARIWGW